MLILRHEKSKKFDRRGRGVLRGLKRAGHYDRSLKFFCIFRKLDDFEKRWRACKQRRIEKEEKRRERKRLKKSIEDSDDECLIIDESLDEEEPPADDYRQILKTWAKTQVHQK